MDNYGNDYNNGYQDNSNGQGQYQQSYGGPQGDPYQQNYGGSQGNSYQQNYGGQQGYQNGPQFIPGGSGTGNNHPKFTTYMVLSILSCCCCNGIFGLVAMIITIIGNGNYKKGEPYEGNFKAAKIILIVGLVLGILGSIISMITGTLPAVMEIMQNSSY
ncbi:MAG: CD225/dispanin family protein [Lachnospiraceae bacterium]|nr:CD225/dispanin family protein [Lachnospiraceae bacterium]